MKYGIIELFLGLIITLSSLGVLISKKPVHSCLCFLFTLITLSLIYQQLSAPFISVMQVLIYAGAILVIFMFVIVLFQDAYKQIQMFKAQSSPSLIFMSTASFTALLFLVFYPLISTQEIAQSQIPKEYGTVQSLGRTLYIDFFFPFEAVGLLFLVAIVGAVYIGKKEG